MSLPAAAISKPETADPATPPSRRLAAGGGWSVSEFVCTSGPGDRPFEEQHHAVSIAMVASGTFNYHADTGRALLHPGALLLGNPGACYQCGHDHGAGDRCISLRVDPAYFAEIAATAAGSSRFRFPVAMLPARRDMLAATMALQVADAGRDPLLRDEEIAGFIAAAAQVLSGAAVTPAAASLRDEHRIARAIRHIERHAADALDLDRLAGVAAMSRFHFLRVFRKVAGQTPHQYLLGVRLRRAALRLIATREPVSAIAYDTGFGDLSTFNAAFRATFARSPAAYRRRGRQD